jgi:integrase/recombinase XerD
MTTEEQKRFDEQYAKHERALKLQGKADRTIEAYTRAVRRLVKKLDCLPETLSPEELKDYFAALVASHSWSTVKIDRNGLQFYWKHVLEQRWDWIEIVNPPKVKSLPDVLTVEEVHAALAKVQKQPYRTCLLTIYSMGLRLGEGISLGVGDIDSARMVVHIRKGKGRKDRYVPLPEATLWELRQYWRTHRNPKLLFPNLCGKREHGADAKTPMDRGAMQTAMKAAVKEANINKKISIHSLRHSYATHLLEAGVHMRLIQEYLGHSSPVSTALYTRLTKVSEIDAHKIIGQLMARYLPATGT